MKSLLIVMHSVTGAARQLAEAARDGARAAEAAGVLCVPAAEAKPDHVLAADGYLFCCPENLGGMSGGMKDFFDRCYYPALGRIEGRAYAVAIAAGSDGEGAARQIARIVTGWRLRAVAAPLIWRSGAQTPAAILAAKTVPPEVLTEAAELGGALAAGLAAGVF